MRSSALLALLLTLPLSTSLAGAEPPHAGYVGGQACADCHAEESAAWQGSHHDLAMQEVNAQTVLGDFAGTEFTAGGVTTRFFRDGERYMVHTDGPDGVMQDYAVRYVFGVDPLQQYLIELPGGRLQALGIAWDTRTADAGGQRWFHLYADDLPGPGDRLHWTAPDQNWNHMCAECHSTDLLKRYQPESDSYATSYAELDVSCEACHGPGAAHVAWAAQTAPAGDPRLSIRLDERWGVSWLSEPGSGKPRRSEPRAGSREISTCARCHSRRGQLTQDYAHGDPVGDHHRVATLDAGLYHPDGQVLDEVYVYGSFLQSRMHAAGVTCSDCHEPHSLQLRAEGDGVCLACHGGLRYAGPQHHHHEPASEAAACVNCHMPATTYMVVDPRRDHSFRIPRPDLSVSLGVPNACNGCHEDREAAWAAEQVALWTGKPPQGYQRHGPALYLAEQGYPAARDALLEVAGDEDQAGIARASAVLALGPWLDRKVVELLTVLLEDDDSLLRRAAVEALTGTPPQLRVALLAARLRDPVRDVRQAAVLALAGLPPDALGPVDKVVLESAVADYRATLALNADRPEAQLNLGVLLTGLGDYEAAESAYRRALAIEPGYMAGVVNLADLLRATGRDEQAGELLDAVLAEHPEAADVQHVRGLLLVRQRRLPEAVAALRRAAELEPANTRYGYVLAVALHGAGEVDAALAELDRVLAARPYDRDSLTAAVVWRQQRGEEPGDYAVRLLELQKLARRQ